MPFVLDGSVAMAWCFEDETTPYARRVLALLRADQALVPAVWPLEVANALCMGERRRRILPADLLRFVEMLHTLPITVEGVSLDRTLGSVLTLAREQQLSSYDASYLELAMREGLALATQDARLSAAAGRVGVQLVRG